MWLRAALGSTTGSGRNSCMPARDSAVVLSQKLRALIKTAHDHDLPMRIVEAVETVNDTRKRAMARKVSSIFAGVLRGKTVAFFGLTFKPNTDDMREAPSIPLIMALQDLGAKVRAYDPVGMEQAKNFVSDVAFCNGPLRMRGRSRCCTDRHGVGTIQSARPCENARSYGLPGCRRSQECLSAGGYEERGLRLCLCWSSQPLGLLSSPAFSAQYLSRTEAP
jgi:UDP-glucose/GDP-mannose dehydrogenase family, UDP binding domain